MIQLDKVAARSQELFARHLKAVQEHTDRMFVKLMIAQWILAVILALTVSPYAWEGSNNQIHLNVYLAIFLGGFITSLPVYLALNQPGETITRYAIAFGQMLMSALLIHLTGGRIETHFHVFGSLAFLAFYRDWRVLVIASTVVGVDHLLRGLFFPQSVFGVTYVERWRWLEHAVWVLFEDIFLIASIHGSLAQMRVIAHHQAELENTNAVIEAKVIEREARTKAIVDTAADGIITISSNLEIETANKAAHQMFQYAEGVMCGKSAKLILPGLFDTGNRLAIESELNPQSAGKVRLEVIARSADGVEFPVEVMLTATELQDHRIYTAVVRDISERKEVDRRVAEFYSTVSHELRTPLTSIRGSLSLMEGGRAGELPARAAQLVKIGRSEAERLMRLINDILDVKKIEAGKLSLKYDEVDPAEIIEATLKGIQNIANEANVALVSELTYKGKLLCDRERVIQVLTNLLANAIKFSSPGDLVKVRLDGEPGRFRFSVSDTGIGIAKAELNKLFNVFQQLDSSDNRNKGGTGLGLAISKSIVEQHGGTIGVESEKNQGATFWFELPSLIDTSTEIIEHVPSQSTILLVEDDHELCQLLTYTLADQGFRVIEAPSIRQAERYLEARLNPDILMLDVQLPDGNGLDLMDRLSQDPETERIPIVVISGREASLGTYGHPMLVDWVRKPFEEERLLGALQLALRTREAERARVLLVEADESVRELIKEKLEMLNVDCLEATDGDTGAQLARSRKLDLIILDVSVPSKGGQQSMPAFFEKNSLSVPAILYTTNDFKDGVRKEVMRGITSSLIKSRSSEKEFLDTVKGLLRGIAVEQSITRDPG